jgi:hypothetical protein
VASSIHFTDDIADYLIEFLFLRIGAQRPYLHKMPVRHVLDLPLMVGNEACQRVRVYATMTFVFYVIEQLLPVLHSFPSEPAHRSLMFFYQSVILLYLVIAKFQAADDKIPRTAVTLLCTGFQPYGSDQPYVA